MTSAPTIRLVLIVECPRANSEADAQAQLDAFREAVLPELNYGLTFYRATEREADAAIYAPEVEADAL